MHPNPGFRKATRAQNIDSASHTGFGTLAVADGVAGSTIGAELDALADWMRAPPDEG